MQGKSHIPYTFCSLVHDIFAHVTLNPKNLWTCNPEKELKINGLSALYFFPGTIYLGSYLHEREKEHKLTFQKQCSIPMLLDDNIILEFRDWYKKFLCFSSQITFQFIKFNLSWECMYLCFFLTFLPLQSSCILAAPHHPGASRPGPELLTFSSEEQEQAF